MQYTVLSDGRIRVEAVNFGEKIRIDFELDCQDERCKINDIFAPQSYKKELIEIVKHERC
ncbi:hypothetical protein BFG52_14990 [Acinetobacter larvae]|uniref:Uncharacterized protein n=1 Tax=Acinetobacter larvae TaxID=1789224 RepID=A0A1B2M491_9GAMM|nr:hypothetical protein BFG52_14990 [Acinetobacter larvae]